jgi:hypothetical protein
MKPLLALLLLFTSCHVCDHSECYGKKDMERVTKQYNSRIKVLNDSINK